MRTQQLLSVALAFLVLTGLGSLVAEAQQTQIDRTTLPIQAPKYEPITELDARKAKAPPRFEVKAPEGAPNVVIVLIDDIGFGAGTSFGGGINTPTLDRLAEGRPALQPVSYHGTLLAYADGTLDRPQSSLGQYGFGHGSGDSIPGQHAGVRPRSVEPLAEMLRLNGYSTAAFGKYHETAPWEVSVSGPFDRWPTRSGFDKFYGFIGGETNMWAPLIYDGTTKIEPPDDPDYHFTTDMANQAIKWMRFQQSLTPDKPFFVYFATGATHAPASRAQGVDRQVQGQVRRRLGQVPRTDVGAADQDGGRAQRYRSSRNGLEISPRGTRSPRTSARSMLGRWKCSRLSQSTPTMRSAGSMMRSTNSARRTTRSLSIYLATTVPAPKAGLPAPSMKLSCSMVCPTRSRIK